MILVERAPGTQRGGNTRHTRDIRYSHPGATAYATGAYTDDEFMEDLLRVTGGETNMELAKLCIRESETVPDWMQQHGVKWQKPLRGTPAPLPYQRFLLGGGRR